MKKRFRISEITLIFTGLLLISAASIPGELSEKTSLIGELDSSVAYFTAPITKVATIEKMSDNLPAPIKDGSTIILDTEYDEFHPTIAGDTSDVFFSGFELTTDDVDYYPTFWYSLDGGVVWEDAGFFSGSLGAEYPDADANDNGFYATFGAPPDNLGQTWLIDATDLSNIKSHVADWINYNIYDFRYPGISCYTRDNEPWNCGGYAMIGYFGYQGADVEGAAWIFYRISETQGAISCVTDEDDNPIGDFVHADFAIDEVTEISYAVYDSSINPNLVVRTDDFGSWDNGTHPELQNYEVGNGIDNITNPSIEANDNTVIIAAEVNDDVVCYYSADGLSTVEQSTVQTDAAYSEVMLSPDGTFVCSYVKNGAIYSKTSEDGATWDDETQVADNEVNDGFGAHDLGKGFTRVYGVWEDTRSEDIDIYFAPAASSVEVPIIEITSIYGGLGISADIKNVGTGDATNVTWTMTVTGGFLGFINRAKSDVIPNLPVGVTEPVKSGILFGLGPIAITVTAGAAKETASGTQIIIFSLVS